MVQGHVGCRAGYADQVGAGCIPAVGMQSVWRGDMLGAGYRYRLSWNFKGSVAAAQGEVRKQQNLAAKAKGVKCTLKCGPLENLLVLHSAQQLRS